MNFFYNIDYKGKITLVTFDEMDVDYPEEDGFVRMKSPIAGFVFTPHPEDPNKCLI